MKPSNHRLAERTLIIMVRDGTWAITDDGRILWAGRRGPARIGARAEKKLPSGYWTVRAMLSGRRIVGLSHRLIWQHLHGDIPEGMVINHKNGCKDDNRPENLEVVSYSENLKHAHRSGLIDQRGERNPAATVPNHDVAAIRLAYAAGGVTMAEVGDRFGVSFQYVSRVVRGTTRNSQLGPTSTEDHRHASAVRDPSTGRFVRVIEFPEVRP